MTRDETVCDDDGFCIRWIVTTDDKPIVYEAMTGDSVSAESAD